VTQYRAPSDCLLRTPNNDPVLPVVGLTLSSRREFSRDDGDSVTGLGLVGVADVVVVNALPIVECISTMMNTTIPIIFHPFLHEYSCAEVLDTICYPVLVSQYIATVLKMYSDNPKFRCVV